MRQPKTLWLTFLLLLLVTLAASPATAQFNQLKFSTYTTEDGLPDNYIVKTITDKKGFLWIATRNGLSRFDGLRFTNYTVDNPAGNGLRSNWITDLAVDNRGTLWISTEWGLCYYDEPANRFRYLHAKADLVVLYKAPMFVSGDVLWVATENGLKKINTLTKSTAATSLNAIPDPQCITQDGEGIIWIGTRGHGAYRYNPATNSANVVFLPGLVKDAHLMGFYKDKNSLWLATSEGLVQAAGTQKTTLFNKPSSHVNSAAVNALTFVVAFAPFTGDSLLICGTYDKRIAIFNKNTGLFIEVFSGKAANLYGIPNSILNNAESGANLLWVSTDKGLVCLNTQLQDYTTYLFTEAGESWNKAMVKKIVAHPTDKSKALLLTNNPAAVAVYNLFSNKIEHIWRSSEAVRYRTILVDSVRNLWLVSDKGLDKFSVATGILPIYRTTNDIIFSAAVDNAAGIWLGTSSGLINYSIQSGRSENFPCRFQGTEIENNSYPFPFYSSAVCPTNAGVVWLTSAKYGLFSFDVSTKIFTPHRQPSQAAYETKNRCSGLVPDAGGQLWISNMAGLSVFDTAAKTFRNYNQKDGLGSTYVYALEATGEGNLIGRGNSGVFVYNTATKKFLNYPAPLPMSSGILEQQVSVVGNKAMVGFEGGLSVYNLQPSYTTDKLPVYIIAGHVSNQAFPLPPGQPAEPVQFSYQQNDLQLQFACVNFLQPAAITYRYQMSGISNQWISAGNQRSVLFTNLSPGAYTFKVVAVTTDGAVSRQPAEFSFVIRPPFWQTFLFRLLLFLTLAGGIWALFKTRLTRLKQQQQVKLDQYKQELELEQITAFFSTLLIDKRTADEVLSDVTKNLIGQLGFDDCMFYLWNEEKNLLEQKTGYGLKGAIDPLNDSTKYHLKIDQGLVGSCFTTGRTVMVNDTAKDPRYLSVDEHLRGSELCVPLVMDTAVLGVVNIEQKEKHFFTARHLQTVSTIATLVTTKLTALEKSAQLHKTELELAEAANRLTSTELAMLRSQMNPHFIFNSLNSIQKYIWEAKQEDAAEYLTKFARLIRLVLEHSGSKLVSLDKELMALRLYVELEHRRSNQKFDYSITVDEALNREQTMVPPLLLQPYIENAIWHGLNPKKEHGELLISIHRQHRQLVCVITDNGIGREASRRQKRPEHRSMGLNISHQRIELMQAGYGIAAGVEVTDEMADGGPAGTKIVVHLPLILQHA